MTNTFIDYLKESFAGGEVLLSQDQAEKMTSYYNLMIAANKEFNITAITQPKEAALLHFFDSAYAYTEIPQEACVLDIGSGGGFPIVPLAIMRTDIRPFALDGSQKKCNFIKKAAAEIGITVETINKRAEDYAKTEGREWFDVCVSRAVTALPALLELCVPLVRPGGLFLAYKSNYKEELESAKNAMNQLSTKLETRVKTPMEGYDRTVLVFRKTEKTPQKYPRNYGQIKKSPL
ncbi:16S rRNA (guanine(527)-N(7))-methyltransferase RsmG [Christensenellaceae bacterium OttesenSCG-928-K19]|nr:16S rRNA (guanine(527)-N(7))-methyltransferase RsmG [Christensenellaceae bacterium OttesenSCG-928-K19]